MSTQKAQEKMATKGTKTENGWRVVGQLLSLCVC